MKKFVKLSVIALFFSSCLGNSITSTSVQLHNNSSYDIYLLTEVYSKNNDNVYKVDYPVKYELLKGDTLTLHAFDMMTTQVYSVWLVERIASLQFGEAIRISPGKMELLEDSEYEILRDEKKGKRYTRIFGYTFTDADYQFALEHGTLVE